MALELEFKLALPGEADLERLDARLGELGLAAHPPVEQQNRFFDTEDLALGREACVLRLRLEGERALLTAKCRGAESDVAGASGQREVEAEIDTDTARALLRGEGCPLATLRAARSSSRTLDRLEALCGDAPLTLLGGFTNLRRVRGPWRLADDCSVLLELDRTDLGPRVDCELEVEVAPEHAARVREALERLLDDLGLAWRTAPSKAQRWFELNG